MYKNGVAPFPGILNTDRSPPAMFEQPDINMQLLAGTRRPANPELRWDPKSTVLKSKLSLFVAFVTGIWLYFTIAFAWALSSKSGALGSFTNPTNSIRILSVLSEGVSLLLPMLVACTSSTIMWATANSAKGLTVSTWLSISPTTSTVGLGKLLWWPKVFDARDWHRPWIIARFIVLASVPMISILIKSFISTTTVYNPLYTFRASGGIGAYNVSYAEPSNWDPNEIAILVDELFVTIFSSKGGTILLNQEPDRSSHLLVGGFGFMQPTDAIFEANFPDADSVFVHQQLGAQIDLWTPTSEVVIDRSDCKIWSTQLYALQLCITSVPGNTATLFAGVSGCFDASDCLQNSTWMGSFDASVMMTVSQRTADVVYSRTTQEITAYSNLSDATAEIIAPSDLILAFDNFFGPDYTSTKNLTDSESAAGSILNDFVTAFADNSTGVILTQNKLDTGVLGSLLACPVIMFQATSLDPNPDDDLSQPQVGQVPDLYISVDLSESKLVAVIPEWTVIVYLIISTILYVFCVGAMFLSFLMGRPPFSSFEIIDFASKAVPLIRKSNFSTFLIADNEDTYTVGDEINNSKSFSKILSGIRNGDDDKIREELQNKSIFVRDMDDPNKVAGFTIEAGRTHR